MTNTANANNKLKALGSVSGGTVHMYTEDGDVRKQHIEVSVTDNVHQVKLDFYLDAEQLLAVLSGSSAKGVEFRNLTVKVVS